MPSLDERRDAAARLRNIAGAPEWATTACCIAECLGEHDYPLWDDSKPLFNRLADLIEPEPICIANLTFTAEQQEEVFQRVTKETQAKKPTLVLYENEAEVCPECGEPLPDYANFCPNCGCKVVEE